MSLFARLAPVIALALLLPGAALAYHPLSTDDPGTTGYRRFELEWGNHLIWPDRRLNEASGYLALKSGLAPGLEFDTALGFTYFYDENDEPTSGFGDAEFAAKYHFLGDGEGPNNLAIAVVSLLPSGESAKGLSEGDTIVPAALLIGSAGAGDWRVLANLGAIFVPDAHDLMLSGLALEWTAADRLALVAELFCEADLLRSGDDNSLEARAGALYSPTPGLTFSAGLGAGLTEAAHDYHFTFATLVGW